MSLPYMPFFVSDYQAKTSHLTLAEDGAYNRLLRLCWLTPDCSVPDDIDWINRKMIARIEQDKSDILTVINEFFTREGARIFSKKQQEVWRNSLDKHEKRSRAGKKGGKSKSLKNKDLASSDVKATIKQPKPEPKPNITHIQPRDLPRKLYAAWNLMAERHGLDPIRMDIRNFERDKRVLGFLQTIANGNPDLLFEAVGNVALNPHWVGKTQSEFYASFDWIFERTRLAQVLEYQPKQQKGGSNGKRNYSTAQQRGAEKSKYLDDVHDLALQIVLPS